MHGARRIAELLALRRVPGAPWKAAIAAVVWLQLCSLGLVVQHRRPRESLCPRPVYVALATALGHQGSASIVLGLIEALRCRCDAYPDPDPTSPLAYGAMPWSTDILQWCSTWSREQQCWVPGSVNVHILAVYMVLLFMYVLTTTPNLWAALEAEAVGIDEVDTGLDLRDPPLYATGASLLQFLILLLCTLAAPIPSLPHPKENSRLPSGAAVGGTALLHATLTTVAAVACVWTWHFSRRPGRREWDDAPPAFGRLRLVLNLMVLHAAGCGWAVCCLGTIPQSEYYSMLLAGWAGLVVTGVMAARRDYTATRAKLQMVMRERGWAEAASSLIELRKKLLYMEHAERFSSNEITAGPSSETPLRTFSVSWEISEADGPLVFDGLDARQLMRCLIEWEAGVAVEWLDAHFVGKRAAWVSKMYQEISAFAYPCLSNRIKELRDSIQEPPSFKQIALALHGSTPLPGDVVEVVAALATPECASIRCLVQSYLPRRRMDGMHSVDNDTSPEAAGVHVKELWRTLENQAQVDTFWAHLMAYSLQVKNTFLHEIEDINGSG
ncbi:hypothetical protein CYMTET_26010 [Cymbomonas tetramitiformis]|uniref:Uncharacterized protein n=1 Tax=Cymbomonas tetramitiformis TaxID=36881 RepID=A0AAE0FSM7_9CHLO|nr:hypothetical protein CYMTET_26010 [Cymbomonas tetramitiformis]